MWNSVAPLSSSAANARASVIGATGLLVRGLVIVLQIRSSGIPRAFISLITLVLGRRKLRLPAAPLLAHFESRYVVKIKISITLDILSIGLQVARARTRSDPVGEPIEVDPRCSAGALQCNREFRAAYERWA